MYEYHDLDASDKCLNDYGMKCWFQGAIFMIIKFTRMIQYYQIFTISMNINMNMSMSMIMHIFVGSSITQSGYWNKAHALVDACYI